MASYVCPSYAGPSYIPPETSKYPNKLMWGPITTYQGVAGHNYDVTSTSAYECGAVPDNACFTADEQTKICDITDGTSNTALFGEFVQR